MDTIFNSILAAPVATLLIISGILFLFIAVAGNISGKIEPGVKGRIASGVLGFALLAIGLTTHFTQKTSEIPNAAQKQVKKAVSSQKPAAVNVETPRESINSKSSAADKGRTVNTESVSSVSSMTENEPNEGVASANLIAEGVIHGSLSTSKDRDFYKFNASGNKTRIILRKISPLSFHVSVDIYDAVEKKIDTSTAIDDTPVSFYFGSMPESLYYIIVKPFHDTIYGDYELEIRKEE